MKLPDQLHCPACKGRLAASSIDALRCTKCEHGYPIADGIADFAGDPDDAGRLDGAQYWNQPDTPELLPQIQGSAGDRWPAFLGDTIMLGCGHAETIRLVAVGRTLRSLLALDTSMDRLRACRDGIVRSEGAAGQPVAYAALGNFRDGIRDAVADTVLCTGMLSGVDDVRGFLAMAYRVLRTNGRAAFVVPNRRYVGAMCLAMAEALVQQRARVEIWPDGHEAALDILAHTRRLLLHRDDLGFLGALQEKHLFDSEALEDLGREAGFATAEMIPMAPDATGVETTRKTCHAAGAPDGFTDTFGAMVGSVGQPFFDLLARQDASAPMLLWLTKAAGPQVRVFSHRPASPAQLFTGPDAALGGVGPRWSIELLARDTEAGIVVTLGGWCLCNTDVRWVRLTLGDVARHAPVWRPRPDVHVVLNGRGLYHPLNTLCSGMDSELLFADVHPVESACPFRLEVMLASGPVVSGAAPERLVMGEPMVVAH